MGRLYDQKPNKTQSEVDGVYSGLWFRLSCHPGREDLAVVRGPGGRLLTLRLYSGSREQTELGLGALMSSLLEYTSIRKTPSSKGCKLFPVLPPAVFRHMRLWRTVLLQNQITAMCFIILYMLIILCHVMDSQCKFKASFERVMNFSCPSFLIKDNMFQVQIASSVSGFILLLSNSVILYVLP